MLKDERGDAGREDLRIKLWPYVKVAATVLEIEAKPDLRRWVYARWLDRAVRQTRNVPKSETTVEAMLSGQYPIRQAHLEMLHEVLSLGDYGLSVKEIWKADDETELRFSPEAFEERLLEARASHRDPFHLLVRNAGPSLGFKVTPQDFGLNLALEGAEPAEPGSDLPVVGAGHPILFELMPRVTGCVLLVSRNVLTGSTAILNEHLGSPRAEAFEAYNYVKLGPGKAAGASGERQVFALNLPRDFNPGAEGLVDLFKRKTVKIEDAELRRLGGAVDKRKSAPEESRLWVGMYRFRIV